MNIFQRTKNVKIYIFVCAFDDSGLDVDVQGVYKTEQKAIEGMMEYFENTCNYTEDDTQSIVNELLYERYYEETGDEYAVQTVYRLEGKHIVLVWLFLHLDIRLKGWMNSLSIFRKTALWYIL